MRLPGNWTARRTTPDQTSHPRGRGLYRIALLAVVLSLVCLRSVEGQQVHHNGFEGQETAWIKGTADAQFQESAHAITDLTAHSGQHSEHIQLTAEQGTYIYYHYAINPAPIGEGLSASVFVKANRPGTRLMARLILPKERDPANLEARLSTTLRGDQYQLVGRWQRLELRNPIKLTKEQQQFMRAELKRDVDFTGAYIDRLILNVYGGPGQTDVWIDDLEVGPVLAAAPFQPASRPLPTPTKTVQPGAVAAPSAAARPSLVEVKQDHLFVGGKGFFLRGIRHSDTPLKALRDAGLNTVWFDYRTPPAVLEEAIALGFWIVPSLNVTAEDPRLASPDGIRGEVDRFGQNDAVLFWELGSGLVEENKDQIIKAIPVVRVTDPQRLVGGDVWDGFRPYTRTLDLVGVRRWPLGTSLELPQYRDWLTQRRNLGMPGYLTWTWIQTHLPDWFCRLVYDRPSSAGFTEPVGPQPEQIRLLTYAALGAGCRGVGFWSDRFLANSHQGRDRLLEMAMLNQEMQMLEPLLVTAGPAEWIPTSKPEVKAAVMRTGYGILVLPVWLGNGSQFVPGQSATATLTVTVPEVPDGAEPWRITPVDVHTLQTKRLLGGTQVTIPEFSLTAAILFTSYNNPAGIVVRFQNQVRGLREQAAQWAKDLAEVELDKVTRVETQLEQAGHRLVDGQKLLDDARQRFKLCQDHWNSRDYRQTYQDAESALRPLRILMRAQWEQAIKGLDAPVASPFAVSFFTLPRHYEFMERLRQTTAGPNLLPSGNFEEGVEKAGEAWTAQQARLDPVEMKAQRVTTDPKEGKSCLMLEIKPQAGQVVPAALERTFLALTSPPVRLPPGTPVRVSGWMRLPGGVAGSVDGALLYDSAGGEPLGIRQLNPTGWKKFTLYRTMPDSGTLQVTLALTGIGTVYFDDIRIEPLTGGRAAPVVSESARTQGERRASAPRSP